MKQLSFSSFEQSQKKKSTKREVFLGEMDAVVPWARLEGLISPHYTKPRRGRPQMRLSVMLRIYFLQQWYGLSDPGAEEALYDMHSMRDFAGLDLARDAIPPLVVCMQAPAGQWTKPPSSISATFWSAMR